jgi:hypothetical protein
LLQVLFFVRSLKRRLAGVALLVVYLCGMTVWYSHIKRDATRFQEQRASEEAEIARRNASAPPFESLPPVPKPVEQMVLLRLIAGLAPYQSGSHFYPAQSAWQLGPPTSERRTYWARYGKSGNYARLEIDVIEFPNAEWANYDVKYSHRDAKSRSLDSNKLYSDGICLFWPSGNKEVELETSGVYPPPPEGERLTSSQIDEFLKIYLDKYPSSL